MNNSIFTIYKDSQFLFRWKLIASNGEPIGSSSESFTSEANCKNNAKLVLS
jgi:uncharacterized protein YegP (UPF0339 family)